MVYLIDTENVASEWIEKYKQLGMDQPDSKIIIAYTDKSSKLSYDQISFLLENSDQASIGFTKCRNGKPNALDFHILGMITKMIVENRDEEYIIVSNDTGFDEFISVVLSTGAHLSRLSCDAEKEIDKETLFAIFDDDASDERITNEKELFAAQRQFLVSNCGVPGSLAEGVRKYLMVSLENAESKINASKAKSIAGNKELKQQIIAEIKAKYDEYRQIGIENTPVSEFVDPKKQAKKLHKLQREFLQTTCKIPKSFADPVRNYLAEGMDYAVDKITESKAKIFKTNKNLKQQIISNLNEHYEEYQKLNPTI